jgi:hyperosmotically inducible protein
LRREEGELVSGLHPIAGGNFMSHSWRKTLVLTVLLSASMVPIAAQAQTPGNKTSSAASSKLAAAPEGRTDDAIQDRIEHRLATDAGVKKYDISVKVSNGRVRLGGSVATDAQKAATTRLATVSGVTKVDNELKVDKDVDRTLGERARTGLTKTGEAITDAWMTARVKWVFIGEDALKDSDISVETKNHVVTLKGTVTTAVGKTRAVQLARETDAVSRVDDQLVVKATPAKSKTTH